MLMRIGLGAVSALVAVSSAQAAQYTLEKIVDTSGAFQNFRAPAINRNGELAFTARYDTGSWSVQKYSGGSLTSLKVGATGSYTGFSDHLDINNSGNVVYSASGNNASAIFLNANTTPFVSASNSSDFDTINGLAINDAGQFAYYRSSSTGGIYRGAIGGSPTVVRPASEVLFFAFTRLGINSGGTVTYPGYANSLAKVYRHDAGGPVTIADTGSTFSTVSDPVLSDAGDVMFRGDRKTGGGTGLYLKPATGTVTELVNSDGAFTMVRMASMNPSGDYAFQSIMDDGTHSIYVGHGSTYELLYNSSTPLLGQSVSALNMITNGIADDGRVAFSATLADGSIAIYTATPLPEPGITLVGGMLSMLALARRSGRAAARA